MNKKLAAALGCLIISSGLNAGMLETARILAGGALVYQHSACLHSDLNQLWQTPFSPSKKLIRLFVSGDRLTHSPLPLLSGPVTNTAFITLGIALIRDGWRALSKLEREREKKRYDSTGMPLIKAH
jgi:hypothetical protein